MNLKLLLSIGASIFLHDAYGMNNQQEKNKIQNEKDMNTSLIFVPENTVHKNKLAERQKTIDEQARIMKQANQERTENTFGLLQSKLDIAQNNKEALNNKKDEQINFQKEQQETLKNNKEEELKNKRPKNKYKRKIQQLTKELENEKAKLRHATDDVLTFKWQSQELRKECDKFQGRLATAGAILTESQKICQSQRSNLFQMTLLILSQMYDKYLTSIQDSKQKEAFKFLTQPLYNLIQYEKAANLIENYKIEASQKTKKRDQERVLDNIDLYISSELPEIYQAILNPTQYNLQTNLPQMNLTDFSQIQSICNKMHWEMKNNIEKFWPLQNN